MGLLLAVASCTFSGCVSIRSIPLGAPFELGPGEGALVVHVRTDSPVVSLEIDGSEAASDLSEGEHLFLIGLAAGRHRWSKVTMAAATFALAETLTASGLSTTRVDSSALPVVFRLGGDDMGFEIEPRRVNFVGMVLLHRTGVFEMYAAMIDRTASALLQLKERSPESLPPYPIVYTGPARHVFLDRYLAVPVAHATPGIDPASGGETP